MRSVPTVTRQGDSRAARPARPAGSAGGGGAVRRGTQVVREQAIEKVGEVSRKLREEGERLLSQQKSRAAGGLMDVGASMQEAASRLHGGPLETVATRVEAVAERVSEASRYLEEQDVATLIRDAEDVVRQRPQWFLGGMFVAGLALARFVKATQNEPARDTGDRRSARRRDAERD